MYKGRSSPSSRRMVASVCGSAFAPAIATAGSAGTTKAIVKVRIEVPSNTAAPKTSRRMRNPIMGLSGENAPREQGAAKPGFGAIAMAAGGCAGRLILEERRIGAQDFADGSIHFLEQQRRIGGRRAIAAERAPMS